MGHEIHLSGAADARFPEIPSIQPPPGEATPEQVHAVDALFAAHQDADAVAGLMNLYAGALLLHDLAAEHFTEPDEDPPEDKRRREKEP